MFESDFSTSDYIICVLGSIMPGVADSFPIIILLEGKGGHTKLASFPQYINNLPDCLALIKKVS
jgi:hypothetical protein